MCARPMPSRWCSATAILQYTGDIVRPLAHFGSLLRPRRGFSLRAVTVGFLLTVALVGTVPAIARSAPDEMPEISAAQLPAEGVEVLADIRKGGPFRYERDGVVFGNYEHLLPAQPRGYYHEYTVTTPNAKNRGARRIICGGPKRTPVACFYTADHYRSFKRIRE
jgi:ribonuclease T1